MYSDGHLTLTVCSDGIDDIDIDDVYLTLFLFSDNNKIIMMCPLLIMIIIFI